MAVIQSGATSDLLTVDATNKAARIIQYDTLGNVEFANQGKLFRGAVSSFRTLGSAGTPQNIFTFENLTGSGRKVAIRRLILQLDATGVFLTVACQCDVSRTTAIPSGGTTLTKGALDTNLSSSANIICRGAAASDGGVATAITATAAAPVLWRQFISRQATAVGQLVYPDNTLIPETCIDDPLILTENTALVVQITGTAATNAATNHYMIMCQWDEYS